MRWRSGRLIAASVLSGMVAFTSVDGAMAQQPKGPTTGGAPKDAKPKKPLTEAQKKTEAKKLFDQAKEKFEKGDYAGSYDLFLQADELVPGASPKYQAALSLDKMGKTSEAIAAYQKFLDSNPEPEKHKDKIDNAKARIEEIKKTPAKVKVATTPPNPPNLKLAVDGAAQPGPELAVPPGKHKITATADGFEPATQEVEVTFGESKDVSIALTESSAPPVAAVPPASTEPTPTAPPKSPPKEPRSNVPAYVTLGLAGVGAIVGTIFGIQALGSKSDFDSEPTTDNADATDRNALIADMSFAVALTFGVTGVVLLVSNDSSDEAKPAGRNGPARAATVRRPKGFVTPYAGPHGGGAAATLNF